ncbi:MAG: peptidoglycan DD-metalloendopeptidase family protein [Myxococcota bacterium]
MLRLAIFVLLAAPAFDVTKDQLIAHLNAEDAQAIFAMFSADMKRAVPIDKLGPHVHAIIQQRGAIKKATLLSADERTAKYRLEAERGDWLMTLAVGPSGSILGLSFDAPPAGEPPVARTAIPLSLPFRGKWLVFWGGDSLEVNQHARHASQRRAADLVMVDGRSATFRNDGHKNEDYLAYGQEILAVAAGKVITLVDGVPDNVPGEMNPYMAPGNLIIIEHGPGIYSAYAHLVPRSARVKVGDRVVGGQALAACGNSGNSSEPHLHFQMQDGPLFERSWGMTAVFGNTQVVRDGKLLPSAPYELHKGDLVQPSSTR